MRPASRRDVLQIMMLLVVAVSAGQVVAGETPVVTVSSTDLEMAEAGQESGNFVITRQAADTSQALSVFFSFGGTVTRFNDFLPFASSPVQIPAGSESVTVTLVPAMDNEVEGEDTAVITLLDSAEYELGSPASVTLTLSDDPPVYRFNVLDDELSEVGLNPASFEVIRSGGNLSAGTSVSVDLTGTANRLSDYTANTNYGFAADQTTLVSSVTPIRDNLVEGTETVIITLRSSSGAVPGDPSTIMFELLDDAPEVNISVIDGELSEAGDRATIQLSRTNAGNTGIDLSVSRALSGSATAFSDYTFDGAFIIPAGDLEVLIDVVAQPDANEMEGDESITVTLQPGAEYLLGASNTASLTLLDFVEDIFGDGFEAFTAKSCGLVAKLRQDPHRFLLRASTVLDLDTGLMWALCGMQGVYDGSAGACRTAFTFGPSGAATIETFNDGFAGDNGGFSDWRLPTAPEVGTLEAGCESVPVRRGHDW
ncbi:MAG: hypothetical protein QNJ40_21380 [Xanthomonadales bacterium]|nr:hypothetical protein [Xanthomonadales bacterium]